MPTIALSTLLSDWIEVPKDSERLILDMVLDSRKVKPGALFFAIKGTQLDGRVFIDQAIAHGAIAIVQEKVGNVPNFSERDYQGKKIPIFSILNLHDHISEIAGRFFGEPSQQLFLIGITGTTGKTSCCHLIANCLEMAGHATGIIGTLGNGRYGHLSSPDRTTPDAIEVQRKLAEFVAQEIEYVVMEVSSHGLEQKRVSALLFKIAIFTNLSREHLDYHLTMENYAQAKRKLFLFPHLKYAVINSDDEIGRQFINEFRSVLEVYAYSASGRMLDSHLPQLRVQQVKLESTGITASVHTPWGDGLLHSRLLGRFNVSNLLAVLTTLGILGIPLKTALSYVANLHGVPGRLELYGGHEKPLIIVDFAHSPDALQQVLSTVREYCKGELWCVFGAGGERDKGKRPQMGSIAEKLADHVILTDDNPRTEDASAITTDILQGMSRPDIAVVEHERHRAIRHALQCAHQDDVVLIAGRGGEQYQVIGTEQQPFNDSVVVQMILAELYSE